MSTYSRESIYCMGRLLYQVHLHVHVCLNYVMSHDKEGETWEALLLTNPPRFPPDILHHLSSGGLMPLKYCIVMREVSSGLLRCYTLWHEVYRIHTYFRGVQIFAIFAIESQTAKINERRQEHCHTHTDVCSYTECVLNKKIADFTFRNREKKTKPAKGVRFKQFAKNL